MVEIRFYEVKYVTCPCILHVHNHLPFPCPHYAPSSLGAHKMIGVVDFKGNSVRNVAIVNATIDRIPFLKVCTLEN